MVRHDDLVGARGLMEACTILFGDQARARFEQYLADHGDAGAARLRLA